VEKSNEDYPDIQEETHDNGSFYIPMKFKVHEEHDALVVCSPERRPMPKQDGLLAMSESPHVAGADYYGFAPRQMSLGSRTLMVQPVSFWSQGRDHRGQLCIAQDEDEV
jgi:hypothetical protein